MQEMWVQSLGWDDLLEKETATHSSILAWKSHGKWSLAGYSPWGGKESNATEHAHTHTHYPYFTDEEIEVQRG